MHLILTGATGLVGAAVLDNMLAQESISRISILSRRPVKMAEGHEKAKIIIHKDFQTYDKALLEDLKDAQGCVWALGVSQNDVDKEYVRCKQCSFMRFVDMITESISRSHTTTHLPPPTPSVHSIPIRLSHLSMYLARARHNRQAC